MNKIDEALVALNAIFYRAQEDGYDDEDVRGYIETIRKALTAAKKREAVDVEGLKKQVHIAHLKQACGNHPDNTEDIEDGIIREEYAYNYGGEDAADFAVDYLVEQGHLTSSEKPTHSIPAAKGEGE